MLNEKVVALLNDQINKELYSAYLYLDMANYVGDLGLDGFAHWYELQAGEERDHALKIRKYLIENDEKVVLEAIAKQENLEVTEADLEDEYSKMAEAYKVEVEQAKASVPADSLSEDIKVQKALDLVKNSAVIK